MAVKLLTAMLILAVSSPCSAASDFAREVCEGIARTGKIDFDSCMRGSGPPDPDMEAFLQELERCWSVPGDEGVECIQSVTRNFEVQTEQQLRQLEQAARQAQTQREMEAQRRRAAEETVRQQRHEAEQAARQAEVQRELEAQRRQAAEETERLEAEADLQDCYGGNYDPDPRQRKPLGEMLVQNAIFCNADLAACLRAGADVNAVASFGERALHEAAASHCENHVGMLVAAGARVNVKNDMGNTPLHKATDNPIGLDGPIVATVRALLNVDAEVNARNNSGDTPLFGVGVPRALSDIRQAVNTDTLRYIAHPSGSDRTVAEALVRAGADPCAQNDLGWIAYPQGCLRKQGLQRY